MHLILPTCCCHTPAKNSAHPDQLPTKKHNRQLACEKETEKRTQISMGDEILTFGFYQLDGAGLFLRRFGQNVFLQLLFGRCVPVLVGGGALQRRNGGSGRRRGRWLLQTLAGGWRRRLFGQSMAAELGVERFHRLGLVALTLLDRNRGLLHFRAVRRVVFGWFPRDFANLADRFRVGDLLIGQRSRWLFVATLLLVLVFVLLLILVATAITTGTRRLGRPILVPATAVLVAARTTAFARSMAARRA
jgi:hypothetical protein